MKTATPNYTFADHQAMVRLMNLQMRQAREAKARMAKHYRDLDRDPNDEA